MDVLTLILANFNVDDGQISFSAFDLIPESLSRIGNNPAEASFPGKIIAIDRSYHLNSIVLPRIRPLVPCSQVTRYYGLFSFSRSSMIKRSSFGTTFVSFELRFGEDRTEAFSVMTRPLNSSSAAAVRFSWFGPSADGRDPLMFARPL